MFSRKFQVIYDKYLQKGSGTCVLESNKLSIITKCGGIWTVGIHI